MHATAALALALVAGLHPPARWGGPEPLALGTLAGLHPPAVRDPGQDAPPAITSFRMQGGAPTVLPGAPISLDHTVAGRTPTAYRVSTLPDFRDASWLPYERSPRWTPAPGGYAPGGSCGARGARLVVYFQVRAEATGIPEPRLQGRGDGAGHVLSNVVSGVICVLLAEGPGVP